MLNTVKRCLPNVIIVIAIIICFFIYLPDLFTGKRYYDVKRGIVAYTINNVDNIMLLEDTEDGARYEQTFLCSYDTITEITLMFAEYAGKEPIKLDIILSDMENDKKLEEWQTDTTALQEYGFLLLSCNNGNINVRDHMCKISIIVPEVSAEDVFGCYVRRSDTYKDGKLYFNGEYSGTDLVMAVYGHKNIRDLTRVRLWLCIYILIISYLLRTLIGREKSE